MSDKIKFPLYVEPRTMNMVNENYKKDGARSRSDYIERAIIFYSGYQNADNVADYYPKVIKSTIEPMVDKLADRVGNQLFKMAVEIAIMENVTAAIYDVDPDNLSQLRDYCIEEVKRLNGRYFLEDAVWLQKGK